MYFGLKSPEKNFAGKRSLLVSFDSEDASNDCDRMVEDATSPAAECAVFAKKFLRSIIIFY